MENQTVQYAFIRFPRSFYTNPVFKGISLDARNLLVLLYDRLELSKLNSERFTDDDGNVFVIYTVDEIRDKFGYGKGKIIRLFAELESNGMIIRKRNNRSRPTKIYFTPHFLNVLKQDLAKSENETSQSSELTPREVAKSAPIYNEYSNNNISNNKSSIIVTDDEIREQIEYDCLYCEDYAGMLNEIVMLISDVYNGLTPSVKIGKEEMPRSIVINRFRLLDGDMVLNVLWKISRNKVRITNMKAYLLSNLYTEIESGECEVNAAFAALYPESKSTA